MPAMIDWITAKFKLDHFGEIAGGRVLKIDSDGSVEWASRCWLPVQGSHDSSLQIKTVEVGDDRDGTVLQISGNPVKWFQGHNLFGSTNVHGLCMETMTRICERLELNPTEEEKYSWYEGDYTLSRVDVNQMYSLGSRANVLSFIRDMEQTASTKLGSGIFKGTTLYYQKGSERWTFKAYSKGQEIESKGHGLPAGLIVGVKPVPAGFMPSEGILRPPVELFPTDLSIWADDKLRLEVTLKQKELSGLGLASGRKWKSESVDIESLHAKYMERIEMNEQKLNTVLDSLPKKLQGTYLLWKEGKDLRVFLSKNTFYRHRTELLEYGINISKKNPVEEVVSNVVPIRPPRPFIHLRDLVPCEIPEWAKGTALYFEPRKFG